MQLWRKTERDPVQVVNPFCTTFSDQQQMYRNLYDFLVRIPVTLKLYPEEMRRLARDLFLVLAIRSFQNVGCLESFEPSIVQSWEDQKAWNIVQQAELVLQP